MVAKIGVDTAENELFQVETEHPERTGVVMTAVTTATTTARATAMIAGRATAMTAVRFVRAIGILSE